MPSIYQFPVKKRTPTRISLNAERLGILKQEKIIHCKNTHHFIEICAMASVYFHIPYCRKACTYCNFHFSTRLTGFEDMVDAMISDWKQQNNFISEDTINSIYFGGGTPSVLPYSLIDKLLNEIKKSKTVVQLAEITLEANPEDITAEGLVNWHKIGINRISLGLQSLNDDELKWMNRAHNAVQSKQSVDLILEHGGFDLSVDLIYGSHLKTSQQWIQELQWVQESGIHHLSCYALTVEEKTALFKLQTTSNGMLILDEHSTQQFSILTQWAQENHWQHYEISNLSRTEKHKAKHNQRYWQGHAYWGIGPGAHGFNGVKRRWNIANNALYTKIINGESSDFLYFEEEILTDFNRFNETLMTQLRLENGVELQKLSAIVNKNTWEKWIHETKSSVKKWHSSGHLLQTDSNLILTQEGRWFADAITADLMLAEED